RATTGVASSAAETAAIESESERNIFPPECGISPVPCGPACGRRLVGVGPKGEPDEFHAHYLGARRPSPQARSPSEHEAACTSVLPRSGEHRASSAPGLLIRRH